MKYNNNIQHLANQYVMKPLITPYIVQDQEQNNKTDGSKYWFKKNYQLKILDDSPNNDHVKLDWIEDFQLKWDYKTQLFKISYKNYESSQKNPISIKNLEIKVNNEFEYKNSNHKDINSKNEIEFISHNLFKKTIPFKDVNVLSICFFFSNNKKREIIFNFGNHKNYKNDFVLPDNDRKLTLYDQVGISINKWNVNSNIYASLTFSVPKIIQGANNYNLVDIYKNFHIKPFDRNYYKIKKISNIPITKDKYANFELEEIIDENSNLSKLVFNKNSFYDLKDKETKIDFGENSKTGYVVPYDFYGAFYPYIDIDLNLYTNIKIAWNNGFKKPYFSKGSGIINLNLTIDNDIINSTKWNEINSSLIFQNNEFNPQIDEFINWLKEKNND